jgi:hypothetical protein
MTLRTIHFGPIRAISFATGGFLEVRQEALMAAESGCKQQGVEWTEVEITMNPMKNRGAQHQLWATLEQ